MLVKWYAGIVRVLNSSSVTRSRLAGGAEGESFISTGYCFGDIRRSFISRRFYSFFSVF